ncbi:MAG: type II toxin-antitoxin system RelE/ParE family toxin [Candidatus Izemoplasmatales bacterium]|nr:type II toxin-antitoxin system RelE/ParE family toxin [Candidatus Izemoplasmatales bacterium]
MVRSYKLLPKAKLDLENIFIYVSEELLNPESALTLIEKFESKFKDICKFPKAYSILVNPSLDNNCLRKSFVDNFLIVYFYDEERELVNIVRVIYAKMDYLNEI